MNSARDGGRLATQGWMLHDFKELNPKRFDFKGSECSSVVLKIYKEGGQSALVLIRF